MMEAAAAAVAAETGYAWVRPTLDRYVDWQQTEGLQRVDLAPPSLSAAEQNQIATLEADAADKMALIEDENSSEDERAVAETALESIERAIETITERPPVLPEELRPTVGASPARKTSRCAS
jgi:ParB family chromosome partitioning protein